MTDIVLTQVTTGYNLSNINSNFDKIEDNINNDVVHIRGGGNTLQQDLDLNGFTLLNVGINSGNPSGILTLNVADSRYLNATGDTLLGGLNLNAQPITNLRVPVNAADPVRKDQLDATNSQVTVINNAQQSGMIGYATKALMDADLSKPDGSLAQVTNDGTLTNNTVYRKSGAIGTGSWVASVDRLGITLTNTLGNNQGYQQLGTGAVLKTYQDKAREQINVRDFGGLGDNSTDNGVPIQRLKTYAGGTQALVKFPSMGFTSTYKINSLAATDLNGLTLDVDPDITIGMPTSAYDRLKSVNVSRQTRLLFNDLNGVDYYPHPKIVIQRDKNRFMSAGDLRYQVLTPIAPNTQLVYRAVTDVTDTFTTVSPTFFDSNGYSYSNAAVGQWVGGFVSVKRNETYTSTVAQAGTGSIGVMLRGTGGWATLTADANAPGTNLMVRRIKTTGGAVQIAQDISFPGRGSYNSYNPSKAVWGVTVVDEGKVLITLNGRAITSPVFDYSSTIGSIFEVGFVWLPTAATNSASFVDCMIENNSDPLGRAEIAEIRFFGDSTVEYMLGMTQDDLKDMLDHTFGVKVSTITNFGVSGTNSIDVVNSIATNGFGNSFYVVVGIGTNDVQGGGTIANLTSNMTNIINSIKTAGRVPVIVLPYMWYTQTQGITGKGQLSTNYDLGAPYRSRIMRLCADLGAILVDPTRELPEPKPAYTNGVDTVNDPLVRDNLHQSALGYKLYANAIARAIASYHFYIFKNKDYFAGMPAEWMQNGWTRGGNTGLWINDQGQINIQGNFAAGTKTDGTQIIGLPRWARPKVDLSFVCSAGGNQSCEVKIQTTGAVVIAGFGANTILNLSNIVYHAA